MKVLIKNVYKSRSKVSKICHEAFIFGELESGFEIKIFDPDCRLPKKLENHFIEMLISIYDFKKKTSSSKSLFKGKYLGPYEISEEWLKLDNHLKKYHLEGNHAIQTQDGVILIDPQDLKDTSVEIGTEIKFIGTRYDLYAWHPIE